MTQRVRAPLISTANITGNLIGSNAVSGNNLTDNLIRANNIVAATITGNLIAESQITGNLIASGAIAGNNIPSNAIRSNNIVAGQITGNLIADNSISTNQILSSAITGNLLGLNAVSSNNIADLSVTGNKIAPTSVSSNHFAPNVSISTSRIVENVNISPQAATGTITINVLDSAIHYYQGNVVSNVTVNLRGNSTAALGSVLNIGQSSSVAVLIPIGGTQYVIQAIQIDGVAQTVRWGGNTKPAYNAGIGNAFTDSYSIIAIKETPSSYIVLASNTAFGVGA